MREKYRNRGRGTGKERLGKENEYKEMGEVRRGECKGDKGCLDFPPGSW